MILKCLLVQLGREHTWRTELSSHQYCHDYVPMNLPYVPMNLPFQLFTLWSALVMLSWEKTREVKICFLSTCMHFPEHIHLFPLSLLKWKDCLFVLKSWHFSALHTASLGSYRWSLGSFPHLKKKILLSNYLFLLLFPILCLLPSPITDYHHYLIP